MIIVLCFFRGDIPDNIPGSGQGQLVVSDHQGRGPGHGGQQRDQGQGGGWGGDPGAEGHCHQEQ